VLKKQNIICISSIDWDFIWQGHQEIMSSLAENGNKVLFIENTGVRAPGIKDMPRIKLRIRNWLAGVKGIRKEAENLYVFSPLVLPLPYSRAARIINKYLIMRALNRWMKAMNFSDPVVWSFLPTPLSVDIADNILKKILIYYCINNFSASSTSAKKIAASEKNMIKKADFVFVTSKQLCNYCSQYNNNTHIFPFAVNFSKFKESADSVLHPPDELKKIAKPIIGYVGGVHKWIDQELIEYAAKKYSSYSFVFVGPLQTDVSRLRVLKNVYFLGKKEHRELPLFVKYFDVCLIPYLITEYTNNVYPTKLNEYLALSKPVVSTGLPEVIEFNNQNGNIVYVSGTKENFTDCLEKAVNEDKLSMKEHRLKVAEDNSWVSRIEQMSRLIEGGINKKNTDNEAKWKENFIFFYRSARRKALSLSAVLVFLWILFFKTPFIWFAAVPLNISQAPHSADAIVVFGGGVGETGSPGKSTIERARYAVELYKEKYAKKIIFSSGYTYRYNDAENMKLFAVSMGVPDKDIILEKKANSTYENVKFTNDILNRHSWANILLVSSPYNTRRAKLVFDKIAGPVSVTYTPVPVNECQFYDRAEGVRFEQIKAIAHEYIGILYYFIKRYII